MVRGGRGHRDCRRGGGGLARRAHLQPEQPRRALLGEPLRGPGTRRVPDVATASPGVALRAPGGQPHGAARGSAPPRAAQAGGGAGYQLGYQVIRHRRHGFVALITMPGDLRRVSGAWRSCPSARVDRVWGALWQESANGEGGTALGPLQWTGHAPGAPDARQLVVLASGAPTAPSRCTLDGVSCSFG